MKNNGHINHACKIYSLIIKDSVKEVSSKLSDSIMIGTRMDDCVNNIIETMTKHIFIDSKVTTTMNVAKPNQLVRNLKDVALNHQRKLNKKKQGFQIQRE